MTVVTGHEFHVLLWRLQDLAAVPPSQPINNLHVSSRPTWSCTPWRLHLSHHQRPSELALWSLPSRHHAILSEYCTGRVAGRVCDIRTANNDKWISRLPISMTNQSPYPTAYFLQGDTSRHPQSSSHLACTSTTTMSSTYPNPSSPVKYLVLFKVRKRCAKSDYRHTTPWESRWKDNPRAAIYYLARRKARSLRPGVNITAKQTDNWSDYRIHYTSYRIMTSEQAPITSHGRGGEPIQCPNDTSTASAESSA